MPKPSLPEGFKHCSRCDSTKPLEDFPKSRSEKFGRAHLCKPCHNKKTRDNRTKRLASDKDYRTSINLKKRLLLRERKRLAIEHKGGVCQDCGGVFPPCAFDFHHLDPKEKDYEPSAASRVSLDKMLKELEKCILLCANCHRIRHNSDI
jgi:hypothetical protein